MYIVNLTLFFLTIFFPAYLLAADMCNSDYSYDMNSTHLVQTHTVSMTTGDTISYHIQTNSAGTLTIQTNNTNNKIDLNGAEDSCPAALNSNISLLTYTGTSAFDVNVVVYASGIAEHTLTITFVPAPIISISCSSNSITESNTSDTIINCNISVSPAPINNLYLIAQAINESATNAYYDPANGDYNASYQEFNLTSTTTSYIYPVKIIGDTKYENDETFLIRVTNDPAHSASIQLRTLPNDYQITIVNDDPVPALEISIRNFFQYEGDSNLTSYLVPIYLTAPATQDTTVTYRFDANATDSSDTNMTDGATYTFTIPNGTEYGLHKIPLVGIYGDTIVEQDENFTITLIGTTDGNILSNESIGVQTILDDDNASGAGNPDYTLLKDVNAIDDDEWIDSTTYNHVIKTKIANKDTSVTVVYIDDLYVQTPYNDAQYALAPLQVFLYRTDSTCQIRDDLSTSTEPVIVNIPNGATYVTSDTFTMVPTANKINRIKMVYADWSKIFDGVTAAANCFINSNMSANFNGLPQCLNSLGSNSGLSQDMMDRYPNIPAVCLQDAIGDGACDSDAYDASGSRGNIYPEIYNHAYGCLACILDAIGADESCSSDNFAIRPNDFNSTITPNQIFTAEQNTSLTFRADQYAGTGTPDYNETMNTSFVVDVNISDSSKTCEQSSIQLSPNIAFVNGLVTNNYTLGNVGDFNLTMHEVNGSEFAIIDADDTNDTARLITPFETNITVIPASFLIDWNLTNAGNGFTYFSNFQKYPLDINMSASLDMNISAKGEANTTLTNYTAYCYAKDGNISIILNNLPLNSDPDGNLTKLLWYDSLHDLNGSVPLPITTNFTMDSNKTQFDNNDSNGTATAKYLINFDRNLTMAVNPILLSIHDVNRTDTDNVQGNTTLDQNATFIYGRTHAPRYRFVGPDGNASIYFESYLSGGNKALLPNGIYSKSTDDPRWFKNASHDTSNGDGVAGDVNQKGFPLNNGSVRGTTASNLNPAQTTLHYYDASTKGYPYKTTMENNASNWLIYNKYDANATKNEFEVEFTNIGGDWAGKRETNTTTHSKGTERTNRRSMW